MWRSHPREQGAVAIVVALITCAVLIPLGALAVDIGSQRVARRDAQAIADTTAMDMARLLAGGGSVTNAAATADAAQDSSGVGSNRVVQVYTGTVSSNYVSDQSLGCNGNPDNAYFTSGGTSPNAVLVTVSNTVGFSFTRGSGGVCRSAIATTSSTACFKLGSYAVAVKSGDSALLAPLNSIFGLNLSLLSYQGIANASVTLAQLAANPRFGTATSLLTGQVTISNLVLATIDALNAQSPTGNAAAITALNSVLTIAGTLPSISLTKVLSVDPNDQAALNTQFNVLDLIAGAVLVADGNHAVSIPNLWANVAGTGMTSDVSLYVQQNASMACGAPNSAKAQADNAQLSGTVGFDQMNSPSINLGVANLKTGVATGTLTLAIAPAHGALVAPPNVHCGNNTTSDPTTFTVKVSSALASASLDIKLPVTGNITILGLGVVSLNLVVDVNVSTTQPAGTGTANISIPPNDTTPISTGSNIRLNSANVAVTIDPSSSATLLGLPLSLVNSLLVPTLNSVAAAVGSVFVPKTVTPLIGNINTLLTGPLAELLGLDVGGADVYGIGATCGSSQLIG